MRRKQILVIGYNRDACDERAWRLAYEVGREVALRGAVLITGGLGGVMEAASKGAYEAGGITVSIIPQKDASQANPYSTVVVATGIGHLRNFVNVYSADGVIVVGGGAGTLSEIAAAYIEGKPIVALKGSGGVADEYAGRYLDQRRTVLVHAAETPREAVDLVLRLISERSGQAPQGS
ncbi:MAG: TIGR00725 family protein [Aigarchaeota archaeon]|nr:TIGR00725 family protein [Candidatus Calditenuis fumarioli]